MIFRDGRLPALDGLRGFAVLLVLAVHSSGWPRGGHLGVDLFFVLSGFLITSLLLEEIAGTGRVSFRRFYARRARRLLPALALLLASYLLIDAAKGRNGLEVVAVGGLYTGNLVQAFSTGPNVLRHSGLEHLWSLAEEEQFYLLWPLLVPWLATRRSAVRWLAAALAALVIWRIGLAFAGASHARLYNGPDTHADGLVAGALVAFLFVRGRLRISLALLLASLPYGAFFLFERLPAAGWDAFMLPIGEVACVCVLVACLTRRRWAHALSWTPLRWFGRISYSLYLWHYMLIWAFGWHHRIVPAALAIAVAYASTRWIEEPIRRRSHRPTIEAVPAPAF